MKKAIPILFIFILLSGCSVFGIRSGYEQPDYRIVQVLSGGVEIRRYSESVAAEAQVESTDRSEGRTAAFRLLFDYISGKNRSESRIEMTAPVETARSPEKIAMTAPVETMSTEQGRVRMRFFLPKSYSVDSAPRPLDPPASAMRMLSHRRPGNCRPSCRTRLGNLPRLQSLISTIPHGHFLSSGATKSLSASGVRARQDSSIKTNSGFHTDQHSSAAQASFCRN
jgi:hypothetical protein